DVIGVKVRVDGLDQLYVELADELEITVDLLQHRIDDQRLAAAPAGKQVGVGTGYAVEQLAEDHARNPRLPNLTIAEGLVQRMAVAQCSNSSQKQPQQV